jgi:zinc/manganese transport system permease protein
MTLVLEFLTIPFLVAIALVGIHVYLGIHVLSRNIIFVDLALAQISALGATVAYMLGYVPQSLSAYAYSLTFTMVGAALLAFTRKWTGRVSQETFIGIIYVVSAATAFLLVDRSPQGAEYIKQILVGSILTATQEDLIKVVFLYSAIGLMHWLLRKYFFIASFQPEEAEQMGMRLWFWDFLFYASFGVVVTSSVAIAGVLLVFSILIVPATIGTLYSTELLSKLLIGWGAGFVASSLGLGASYVWDLPTGAAMVCAFGFVLAISASVRPFILNRATDFTTLLKRSLSLLSNAAIALILSSALWLVINPHADQPILDGLETFYPDLSNSFLNTEEKNILTDASISSEYLRSQINDLDRKEQESRWLGEGMSDEELRTLASYTISFQEMDKGEQFVRGNMKNKARDRQRWIIGIPAIGLSISCLLWRTSDGRFLSEDR